MDEKVIAIVPAHNEEKNIRLVIDSLKDSVRAGVISDFVVVANGCRDKTYSKSVTRGANTLKMPVGNKGAAFIQGVKWAHKQGASMVVTIDADAERFAPSAVEHLIRPVLEKKTPMSISRFVYKNGFEFPAHLSGFRAISMGALKPILASNRDWVGSFTMAKYSLETALNAKIFGIHYAKFSPLEVPAVQIKNSAFVESKLLRDSVQAPLFSVRRKIRDLGVRHDLAFARNHFEERIKMLEQKRSERNLKVMARKKVK